MNIIKIYAEHTALVEKETTSLACKSGCTMCCKQFTPCTKLEWDAISNYLVEHKLHTKIRKRNAKLFEEWKKYKKVNLPTMAQNPKKVFVDWMNKPCIFLNEQGACDVYEVRPMNCRTLTSTVTCTSLQQNEAKQFRFEYDRPMSEPIWHSGHTMVLPDLFLGLV